MENKKHHILNSRILILVWTDYASGIWADLGNARQRRPQTENGKDLINTKWGSCGWAGKKPLLLLSWTYQTGWWRCWGRAVDSRVTASKGRESCRALHHNGRTSLKSRQSLSWWGDDGGVRQKVIIKVYTIIGMSRWRDLWLTEFEMERDCLPQLGRHKRNTEPNYRRARDTAHGQEETKQAYKDIPGRRFINARGYNSRQNRCANWKKSFLINFESSWTT